MRTRIPSRAAFCFVLAVGGCNGILGIEEATLRASAGDAGQSDGAAADACPARAVAPPRPSSPDGTPLLNLVFAAEDLRADTETFASDLSSNLPAPKSLDLDQACAGFEPPSCRRPEKAPPVVPQPDGRDNVMGPLLADLASLLPVFDSGYVKRRISSGLYTILFEIREWNGTDNDPHVIVTLRISAGTHKEANDAVPLPKVDGQDVWDIDPRSVTNGLLHVGESCENSNCLGSVDTNAYVSGGTLVARFDSSPLPLSTTAGDLNLSLKGAVMTAKITKTDKGSYRIDGELAGRVPTSEFLSTAGAGIPDPTTGKSLCTSPMPYTLFKRSICASADLAATPETDRTNAPCEALSEAVSFTGSAAKLGLIRAVTQQASDCAGFTDSCSN